MKKYINIAFIYALLALAGGVFYREFTKWNGFSGACALGKLHVHLFMLGTAVFLLVALFADKFALNQHKTFNAFMIIYNIGLPLTAVMLAVRGIVEVLDISLSSAVNAAVSGIAGIGHILTGTGIVLLLLALKKSADN
ncbi:MAG: DUF2871 domain-containing protein [Acutalibacteraceae bacterium]